MEQYSEKRWMSFTKKLFMMTDSLVVVCNEPSPPLFTVAANMMCQAAEEAIRKFSVDPTARNVGHSQ
jgi:hypothetical protein